MLRMLRACRDAQLRCEPTTTGLRQSQCTAARGTQPTQGGRKVSGRHGATGESAERRKKTATSLSTKNLLNSQNLVLTNRY